MSGKQPEALWLATCLQNGADDPMWAMHCEMSKVTCEKAATELRRLHALNAELAGALQFILAFYEPGQTYLDTEAWKHAEASGRAALSKVTGAPR